MKAAASGSVPAALRRSATAASTRRHAHRQRFSGKPHGAQGLGSARLSRLRRRSRGWAPVTSRSRCAACAGSRARGAAEELDLDDNDSAAPRANAGWLDIKLVPQRHNRVKVLMLLDVGGSMDDHIKRTEELFSAAKSEFKHLEFFYFHNCVYDYLWKKNQRRQTERFSTWDVPA